MAMPADDEGERPPPKATRPWRRPHREMYDGGGHRVQRLEVGTGAVLYRQGLASHAGRIADTANVAWDCSLVMARLLAMETLFPAGSWQGASVIELGAGLGIPGLAAAAMGARVVLTDLEANLPLLRENIALNWPDTAHPPVTATSLQWEDVSSAALGPAYGCPAPPFQVVLLSDLLFDDNGNRALASAARALADANTAVLCCFEHRWDGARMFYDEMQALGFGKDATIAVDQMDALYRGDDFHITVFRLASPDGTPPTPSPAAPGP
eukprot:gene808-2544_t